MMRFGFKVKSKHSGRKAVQATERIHYSMGISITLQEFWPASEVKFNPL